MGLPCFLSVRLARLRPLNSPSPSAAQPSTSSAWLGRLKLVVRAVVIALVVWGVWYTVQKAARSLQEEEFAWSDLARLDVRWLLAAGAIYLAGLAPACWFWRQVLRALGQRPMTLPLVRAYFIGHLGKYVPGKALVVVLRTGLIRGAGVDATTAAVSVFVETLTMMAVGAGFAAALLAALYREQRGLLVLGVAMALGAGIPTLPPIFRRLVMILQVKRLNPQIESALRGLDWRLALGGWTALGLGWCLLGASLAAVLQSIPGVEVQTSQAPLIAATVALAMVAGFLSLIPGGLGVRELVVIPLLAPVYGHGTAIVSAVLLRLIWLIAELSASSILYVARPVASRAVAPQRDAADLPEPRP